MTDIAYQYKTLRIIFPTNLKMRELKISESCSDQQMRIQGGGGYECSARTPRSVKSIVSRIFRPQWVLSPLERKK